MQARQLGKSAVHVTPIIFGAWAIGGWMWGGSEESESLDAIRASLDAGVTTIDTAAIYGQGYSEELVGKAIKGRRDKVVVATKCGMRWDTTEGVDPWKQKNNAGQDITIVKNARPDSIAYECEQSLKRLAVDVIDLYQIHWPDSSTPPEETARALDKLRQQGKVKAIGVSNYDGTWLARAAAVAPIASNQPPYSILQRKIEKDSLPVARELGIGVICYSPLERGLLTGKVGPDRTFPPGDHRSDHPFFTRENRQHVAAALQKAQPLADRHKASLAQLMINWTFSQPGITAAIVGARNAEQARHNAGAMQFKLSAEELADIRRIFDDCSAKLMGSTAKK